MAVSVSHAYPHVIAASTNTKHVELGVDVERIRTFAPEIWKSFLTPREKELIAASPVVERAYLRTLAWSGKESVLKAIGVGLRMHPKSIDVSELLRSRYPKSIEIRGIRRCVEMRHWRIAPEFVATVVALQTPTEIY
uniref:4'-phosphopantetheinyl transferase n=1 Tax=uncultured bacterium CSLC2 TaxID=1091571 RepID=Q8KNZ9_9BACT|nr:4'-phosphopantetheinyl transferase [uncultured bacterium CSLC2]